MRRARGMRISAQAREHAVHDAMRAVQVMLGASPHHDCAKRMHGVRDAVRAVQVMLGASPHHDCAERMHGVRDAVRAVQVMLGASPHHDCAERMHGVRDAVRAVQVMLGASPHHDCAERMHGVRDAVRAVQVMLGASPHHDCAERMHGVRNAVRAVQVMLGASPHHVQVEQMHGVRDAVRAVQVMLGARPFLASRIPVNTPTMVYSCPDCPATGFTTRGNVTNHRHGGRCPGNLRNAAAANSGNPFLKNRHNATFMPSPTLSIPSPTLSMPTPPSAEVDPEPLRGNEGSTHDNMVPDSFHPAPTPSNSVESTPDGLPNDATSAPMNGSRILSRSFWKLAVLPRRTSQAYVEPVAPEAARDAAFNRQLTGDLQNLRRALDAAPGCNGSNVHVIQVHNELAMPAALGADFGRLPHRVRAVASFYGRPWYSDIAVRGRLVDDNHEECGIKFLKRIFAVANMTDDCDEGVIVQRDLLDEAGEDGDSKDDLNLDEMLGYMQQLKQSGVKLGKKKKKKKGRLSTLLANSSSDGAGPSSTPTDTAAETTPATTAAFTVAAVTELAAPSDSPMPLAASTETTTDASAAVSIPVGATTEITPAVTVVNAASVSTPSPNTALASAGAANQTSTVADASGVTAAAADNPTAGTAAGRVLFRQITQQLLRPSGCKFYPEWAEFREVVCMKYENAGVQSDVFYYVISNDPNKEALAMRKVLEKRSNVNSDAKTFGRGLGGGRLTPALDTAEAVNRRNVALKIDQVAAWIKATYDAGDVAIWDSRPPASFNMSPVIKILVEGFESVIFPNGTPP
ncbi:unnamed protein product [Closterium sp. NIES-65]|nr:unnamed protein product [Closterium sp. NIES-65]